MATTSPLCWQGLGSISEGMIEKSSFPRFPAGCVRRSRHVDRSGGSCLLDGQWRSQEDLDFAAVQRSNPEMERRCQEVIDRCWSRGSDNPILLFMMSGLVVSNALPELVHDAGRGEVSNCVRCRMTNQGMSPLEIWCNEAQERYVLAIDAERLEAFEAICERERCPYASGQATVEENLLLGDSHFENHPSIFLMPLLFGKPPRMLRESGIVHSPNQTWNLPVLH